MIPRQREQEALDHSTSPTDAKLPTPPTVKLSKPFSWSKSLGRGALYSLAIFFVALIVHLFSSGATPFADFAMWISGPLLVGSVVILGLIEEQKEIRRKGAQEGTTAAFLERNKTADIYISAGYGRVIGVDWDNRVVFIGDTIDNIETVPFADLLEASVDIDAVTETVTTSNTKTNRGSQVGNAAAAGLLLGPAGLIIGSLTAGSKTTGKSVAKTLVKSITLVVRVRSKTSPVRRVDLIPFAKGRTLSPNHGIIVETSKKAAHYRALLTQIIEEQATPTTNPRSAPNGSGVADQLDRLWTLHEKGALSRAEYNDQKAKVLASGGVATAVMAFFIALAATLYPIGAKAYDLGHLMRGTPELRLTSTKSLGSVEQCIVLSDLPSSPIVYRYPDKAGSLIHGGRDAVPHFLFELLPAGDHLDIVIWQGSGMKERVRSCL